MELTHDVDGQGAGWEGQVSYLKRVTERTVERSQRAMIKRVDKVHDRVVEAEARDATQEREMKDGLEKLLKSV